MLNEAIQRLKAAPARVVYLLFALALVVGLRRRGGLLFSVSIRR
jgi:hypothetical protein